MTIATMFLMTTLLLTVVGACGDDSDSDVTASPTRSGPPDLSPEVGGVEAAGRYLLETGVDGKKGEFTDPRSCAEINDTRGDFCVHEGFSTYAAGLVILRFADKDKPDEEVWEMRLSLTNGQWQVTSVQPFGETD